MITDNAKLQMRKGVLELCVLAIIAEHEDVYPSDIKKGLESTGMDIVEGTLYPLLMRLKNTGYLTYTWKESETGPPRKYYKLTDTGFQYLLQLKTDWNEFTQSVNNVIQYQPLNKF